MKEIALTRGQVALVDDEDFESLSAYKWRAHTDRYSIYAIRLAGGKTILMHRVLLDPPAGMHVDHISGDGLDNRRENLRLATVAQNLRNRGANRNNKLGIKGVSQAWSGKWRATISTDRRQKHLGYFDSPQAAHAAYRAAAEELHGEFARFA